MFIKCVKLKSIRVVDRGIALAIIALVVWVTTINARIPVTSAIARNFNQLFATTAMGVNFGAYIAEWEHRFAWNTRFLEQLVARSVAFGVKIVMAQIFLDKGLELPVALTSKAVEDFELDVALSHVVLCDVLVVVNIGIERWCVCFWPQCALDGGYSQW